MAEYIFEIVGAFYDEETGDYCLKPKVVCELVRCKDCRWGKEVCGNIECFVDINVPPEYHGYEWFCPNGERRTDG